VSSDWSKYKHTSTSTHMQHKKLLSLDVDIAGLSRVYNISQHIPCCGIVDEFFGITRQYFSERQASILTKQCRCLVGVSTELRPAAESLL
jgi:hypothetical protein